MKCCTNDRLTRNIYNIRTRTRLAEIEKKIAYMKNNKIFGPNGVTAEVLKAGFTKCRNAYIRYFQI